VDGSCSYRPTYATLVKILVTGATSLVGGHTATQLAELGHEVTVFQRSPSGLSVAEFRGSLTNINEVRPAVAGQDAVVHLAAKVGVTGTWDEFHKTNVSGTQTLIETAQKAGVGRFVHISSPSVAHGGAALVGAPTGVADPTSTRGHYATSKALAEQFALAASSSSMPIVALRPHLIWGPGDTQLVGRIVAKTKAGRMAMIGSGNALIDSTFITNAVDAIVAAVDAAPGLGGQAFVVSNGQPRTVSELIGRIAVAAGLTPSDRHVPARLAFAGGWLAERTWERQQRTDDPPMTSFLAEQLSTAHWFDQRATRDALNWTPEVGIDEGFERLRAWFQQQ